MTPRDYTSAGQLRERYRFEQRALDANGDRAGPWAEVCTVWTKVTWLRGGEPVLAQRLQGVQPAVFTVRASGVTRSLGADCRAVDARIKAPEKGDYFQLHTATVTADRAFVEILAERGVDG